MSSYPRLPGKMFTAEGWVHADGEGGENGGGARSSACRQAQFGQAQLNEPVFGLRWTERLEAAGISREAEPARESAAAKIGLPPHNRQPGHDHMIAS